MLGFFFFCLRPVGFAMGAVLFLNELHVCKIDTEGGVRFHQDRCGFKRTKRLKRSHFQHCAHRFATGLVLSFNVSDCDDFQSHVRRFWRRFSMWLFAVSRLSMRVSAASVERNCCCGVGECVFVAKRRQMMTQTTSNSTELKRV